ncbi:elongin BC and Polycomb repressive complex 2-associated protein [Discoglossus pictus]
MEPPAGYQEIAGMRLGYLRVGGRQLFALAQVLSGPLRGVPRGRVCRRMERLQIQSRRCDLRELRALKALRSVPSRAVQCCLISREDLHILCSSRWGPKHEVTQVHRDSGGPHEKDCISPIRTTFAAGMRSELGDLFPGTPRNLLNEHSSATSVGYSSPSEQTSSSDSESDISGTTGRRARYRHMGIHKRRRDMGARRVRSFGGRSRGAGAQSRDRRRRNRIIVARRRVIGAQRRRVVGHRRERRARSSSLEADPSSPSDPESGQGLDPGDKTKDQEIVGDDKEQEKSDKEEDCSTVSEKSSQDKEVEEPQCDTTSSETDSPAKIPDPEPRTLQFDRLVRQSKLWCYARGFRTDMRDLHPRVIRKPKSHSGTRKVGRPLGSRNKKNFDGVTGSPHPKRATNGPTRPNFSFLDNFPAIPSLVVGEDGDLSPAYSLCAKNPLAVSKAHPLWSWHPGGNAIPLPPSLKFRTYPLENM